MQVPVSEAAILVGLNRKTLYKHIKSGKLSATRTATGERQIETSELIRVYGALKTTGDTSKATAGDSKGDSDMREVLRELAALRKEVQELKEQLALPSPKRQVETVPETIEEPQEEASFKSIIARLKEKQKG